MKKMLVLAIPHTPSKQGISNVDFGFLVQWLGESRASRYGEAILTLCTGGKSANYAYNIRAVLRRWKLIAPAGPAYLDGPSGVEAHEDQIAKLRLDFYAWKHQQERKFNTVGNAWRAFALFLNMLATKREVPRMDYLKKFPPVPGVGAEQFREGARLKVVDEHFYPSSLSHELDAFHTGVIVPLSLSLTDGEYLAAYEKKLDGALGRIRNAAMQEIEQIVAARKEGNLLIERTNYEEIRQVVSTPTKHRLKNTDPKNGLHFFNERGGHPNVLGNLLAIIENEMGGIPAPRVHENRGKDGVRKSSFAPDSRPHWLYVSYYGKNRLLPYLGVLTSRTMVPFLVLILLEHPRVTVSALLRARLSDSGSTDELLVPGLEGNSEWIEVEKPRAKAFKSMKLTCRSKAAIGHLIDLTSKVRDRLKGTGIHDRSKSEDWRSLWVGMHMIDYRTIRVSEKQLTASFRVDPKFSSQTDVVRATRLVTFADTHFQGEPWRTRITLKSLRVSAGVLSFVKSGGDIVAAARTLGHKDADTTINHYIPKHLQIAIYEHRIRRHQNVLLVLSSLNRGEMLKFTDFESTEDLHIFLSSVAPTLEAFQECQNVERAGLYTEPQLEGRLVLHADPYTVAIAMLYRDHVASWPDFALDRPDSRSGVTPRGWSLLVKSLEQDLPDSLRHITNLVASAAVYRDKLRALIRFPGYA